MIGPGGLSLIVPHLFVVPVSILWMDGVTEKYITKLGCEIILRSHILSTAGDALRASITPPYWHPIGTLLALSIAVSHEFNSEEHLCYDNLTCWMFFSIFFPCFTASSLFFSCCNEPVHSLFNFFCCNELTHTFFFFFHSKLVDFFLLWWACILNVFFSIVGEKMQKWAKKYALTSQSFIFYINLRK